VHERPVRSLLLDDLLTERLRDSLSAGDFRDWTANTHEFIRQKNEFEDTERRTRKRMRCREVLEFVIGTMQVIQQRE
jgi:hypothetical protein